MLQTRLKNFRCEKRLTRAPRHPQVTDSQKNKGTQIGMKSRYVHQHTNALDVFKQATDQFLLLLDSPQNPSRLLLCHLRADVRILILLDMLAISLKCVSPFTVFLRMFTGDHRLSFCAVVIVDPLWEKRSRIDALVLL